MQKPDENELFLKEITVEPLTIHNWFNFVQLFGERGACGNCWCMYYRLGKSEYLEGKIGEGNKDAMKQLVWSGKPAGILAIYQGQAIAWCAFAPREDFIRLAKSRVHKRIDNELVWSIPCLYVNRHFRRHGVSEALLRGVTRYAAEVGIKIIEAYPAITSKQLPDPYAWIGLYQAFERAGFKIVDQTSKNRPMVRFYKE
jgi:GNAT superfamily N-acetyltransferase